jgi:Uma2 family endonuclease
MGSLSLPVGGELKTRVRRCLIDTCIPPFAEGLGSFQRYNRDWRKALMSTATKPMTLAEFAKYADDGRYELVDGELLEREMSNKTVRVGGIIYGLLLEFSLRTKLGEAQPDGISYRCFSEHPNRVRKPDVSWFSAGRWKSDLLDTTYIEIAPDLIVEVVSPNDNAAKINRKAKQFIEAGSQEAWIVFPDDGEVERRYADRKGRWYSPEEEIDGAPLLPGFNWKLSEVLAKA